MNVDLSKTKAVIVFAKYLERTRRNINYSTLICVRFIKFFDANNGAILLLVLLISSLRAIIALPFYLIGFGMTVQLGIYFANSRWR